MPSGLTFVAALLVAALAVIAPASYGRLDLHRGELLHLVFHHPHPSAPTETDGPMLLVGAQLRLEAAAPHHSGSSLALAGEVLPRPAAHPPLIEPGPWLDSSNDHQPTSPGLIPPDPPPEQT